MRLNPVIIVAALGLLMSPALAADVTWSGANGTSWDDALNWDALPASGDNVAFIGLTSSSTMAVLQSSTTVGNITFNSTAAANGFTLSGTIPSLTLAIGGNVTVADGFSGPVISAQTLANGPANTFDIGSGSTLTLSSGFVAASPHVLTKQNAGILILSGTNTLQTVNVTGGTLNFSGTDGAKVVNGPVTLTNSAALTCINGNVTDFLGAINLNDSSKATLGGNVSGPITVATAAGRLTIESGIITGAMSLANGTVLTVKGGTISPTGGITAGGATAVNVTLTPQFTVPVVLNDDAVWNNSGGTPTYGGTASFTLSGNAVATLRGGAAAPLPGPISASGLSAVTLVNGAYNGNLTFSNTAKLTAQANSTINGNVTIGDDVSATLFGTGNASQTVTVNGNGLVTMGSNGKRWGNFDLHNNAKVVFSGNEKPGGVTMTDNSRLDMSGGAGTDVTFNGSVIANGTAGGLIQGTITGNLDMSGNSSFDTSRALKVNGSIVLSGSSHFAHLTGLINYNVLTHGNITFRDDSTSTDPSDSGWNFYNTASTLTVQDRAVVDMNVGKGDSPVVTQGYGVLLVHHYNGCKQTQSVTAGGASSLTMFGGSVSGNIFANDGATVTITESVTGDITASGTSTVTIQGNNLSGTPGTLTANNSAHVNLDGGTVSRTIIANENSSVRLGGAVSGLITVAPGASIAFTNGTLTSDISGILDSQVTYGGGAQVNRGSLTVSSTFDVQGSKTLNVVDWPDPADRGTAMINVRNLTGTGTVIRAGGPNVTLQMTGTTNSWVGNVLNSTGVLMFSSTKGVTQMPAGLGKIVLGSADSTLFIRSNTYDSSTTIFTGRTIEGVGSIVASDTTGVVPDVANSKVIAAGATIRPMNGTLNMMGDLEFAMNGPTAAQVKITSNSKTAYGKLLVTGPTGHGNLTGLENAALVLDFKQTGAADWADFAGATMTVVQADAHAGLGNLAFNGPATWTNEMRGVVTYTDTTVSVWNVHNTHQTGDGNGDLKVDIADYTLYFNNYGDKGAANAYYPGDFTGDGKVDIADYTAYFNNYGDHSAGHSAVPEPATMALLALGGLAILRRRK